ncbi:MAG: hypothetical protein M1816_006813 [Peltula sp. TS41687]|nr:MAG: hypothetical protein M1816_006813 [Peltula sp. TS41687]
MATFITELMSSIFTPGPTPTLLVATNATFASLQIVLALLLAATRSIHFVILSILCGGLWWAINWFASELRASGATIVRAKGSPGEDVQLEEGGDSGDDTEREGPTPPSVRQDDIRLASDLVETLRQRRSSGDGAGDVSTEDEWERIGIAGL